MQKLGSIVTTLLAAGMCSAGTAAAQQTAAINEPFVTGPPHGDGPVVVRAVFQLRDINDIDDEAETFEFGAVLTLTWRDERQAFDPAVVGAHEKVYQGDYQFDEVFTGWFPQVVLVNESGLYDKQGVVLRVKPDGTLTLIETLDAAAEAELDLRSYPFDRQQLNAVFEVLGFDESEVQLAAEPATIGSSTSEDQGISLPQWALAGIHTSVRERYAPYAGSRGVSSAFVVSMDMRRKSFFMVRLIILPLTLIVMLSWSVFWMDRSSLGDRINVSFIGILTAVAYQIVVSEMLPRISYLTFMNGFLNISFIAMCTTVVINLAVGAADKRGMSEVGDRIDFRCRWAFPLAYFGLLLLMSTVTFLVTRR